MMTTSASVVEEDDIAGMGEGVEEAVRYAARQSTPQPIVKFHWHYCIL